MQRQRGGHDDRAGQRLGRHQGEPDLAGLLEQGPQDGPDLVQVHGGLAVAVELLPVGLHLVGGQKRPQHLALRPRRAATATAVAVGRVGVLHVAPRGAGADPAAAAARLHRTQPVAPRTHRLHLQGQLRLTGAAVAGAARSSAHQRHQRLLPGRRPSCGEAGGALSGGPQATCPRREQHGGHVLAVDRHRAGAPAGPAPVAAGRRDDDAVGRRPGALNRAEHQPVCGVMSEVADPAGLDVGHRGGERTRPDDPLDRQIAEVGGGAGCGHDLTVGPGRDTLALVHRVAGTGLLIHSSARAARAWRRDTLPPRALEWWVRGPDQHRSASEVTTRRRGLRRRPAKIDQRARTVT